MRDAGGTCIGDPCFSFCAKFGTIFLQIFGAEEDGGRQLYQDAVRALEPCDQNHGGDYLHFHFKKLIENEI